MISRTDDELARDLLRSASDRFDQAARGRLHLGAVVAAWTAWLWARLTVGAPGRVQAWLGPMGAVAVAVPPIAAGLLPMADRLQKSSPLAVALAGWLTAVVAVASWGVEHVARRNAGVSLLARRPARAAVQVMALVGVAAVVAGSALGAASGGWSGSADSPEMGGLIWVCAVGMWAMTIVIRDGLGPMARAVFQDDVMLAEVVGRSQSRADLVELGALLTGYGTLMSLAVRATGLMPVGQEQPPYFLALLVLALCEVVIVHRWAIRGLDRRLLGPVTMGAEVCVVAFALARFGGGLSSRSGWFELAMVAILVVASQPLSRLLFDCLGRVNSFGLDRSSRRAVGWICLALGLANAVRASGFLAAGEPYSLAMLVLAFGLVCLGLGVRGDRFRPLKLGALTKGIVRRGWTARPAPRGDL